MPKVIDLSETGKSGLVNLGNTCYMNSVIQALRCTMPLTTYLLNSTDGNNMTQFDSSFAKDKKFRLECDPLVNTFLHHWVSLLVGMWEDNSVVRPKTVRTLVGIFHPPFSGSGQQDAHECLTMILDKLDQELKLNVNIKLNEHIQSELDKRLMKSNEAYQSFLNHDGYSVVKKMFYGQFETCCLCLKCKTKKYSYDAFSYLSLSIPDGNSGKTLYDCLTNYIEVEQLVKDNKYSCGKCGHKTKAVKQISLWKLPEILIIQLKRFDVRLNKINKFVHFPLVANLTKYVFHPNSSINAGLAGATKEENPLQINGLQIYNLYAVIEHSGSLIGGHYTSKCKMPDDKWYKFVDSRRPEEITVNQITSKNSYILFYQMHQHSLQQWNKFK